MSKNNQRIHLTTDDLEFVRNLEDIDLVRYWQQNIIDNPHCYLDIRTVFEAHWYTIRWTCRVHAKSYCVSVRKDDGMHFTDLDPMIGCMVYSRNFPNLCSAYVYPAMYMSHTWTVHPSSS
jgi:hypothetical protein